LDPGCFIPIIFLAVALIFGTLTYHARYILVDKKKTQLFAFIAIMGMLSFMVWAFIYLP
jgi:hypothetical protein